MSLLTSSSILWLIQLKEFADLNLDSHWDLLAPVRVVILMVVIAVLFHVTTWAILAVLTTLAVMFYLISQMLLMLGI